ncbi:MAG: DNA/RNA non-specific endonuclease [Bacteroidales bacterium]|nr:DNA/RNA non-specific endonuclease [Bacteroidales bacterium]
MNTNKYRGQAALDVLEKNKPNLKKIMDGFMRPSENYFVLEELYVLIEDEKTIIGFGAKPTRIEMVGNTIYAKGGSASNKIGDLNEFLNNPLPNTVYIVDSYLNYETDDLCRTISVKGDLTHLSKMVSRTDIDKKTQKKVCENSELNSIKYNAGHIIQRSIGGLNEWINLLCMSAQFNNGKNSPWRKLEVYESKEIAQGKDVKVEIRIEYYDQSRDNYGITKTLFINGSKKTHCFEQRIR